MKSADPRTGLVGGTMLVMAAEALAFPAGLIATVLLTHHLPPSDYGALALALAGIAWLEWTVVSLFSRAAWKLIAEAEDWRIVATAIVRTFLLASLAVAALVFVTAAGAAAVLGIPQFTAMLRILSVEIPLFVAAHAYRTVLIGRGMHGSRAAVAATRWCVRAFLIALAILLGLHLPGICALIVMATGAELLIARSLSVRHAPVAAIRGTASASTGTTVREVLRYSAPLIVSAICLRLFERADIFAVRVLGGSMESVAAYGVAQNLALAPALFGSAFAPALIAALSSRFASGDAGGAQRLGNQALRAGFLVLALTLLLAGAAPSLIQLLFGARYLSAAPIFSLLIVGAAGTLIIALAGGTLVAAGQLRWTMILTAPLLAIAVAGHWMLVPRLGALGAAIVTASTAFIGATASCIATRVLVSTPIPVATLSRVVVLGSGAGWLMHAAAPSSVAVLPLLCALAIAFAIAMALTGELRAHERSALALWIRTRRAATAAAPTP